MQEGCRHPDEPVASCATSETLEEKYKIVAEESVAIFLSSFYKGDITWTLEANEMT